MKTADNKIFVALATTNVFAFIMIFILVWLLWESNKNTQETSAVVVEKGLVTGSLEQTQAQQTLSDSTLKEKALQDRALKNQTVKNQAQQSRDENQSFLKQKVVSTFELVVQEVKAAELDMSASTATKSEKSENNEDVVSGISDKEYISAFNQLDKQTPTERQYTKEQVSTVQVVAALGGDASAKNHFNKVDVSQYQSKKALTRQLGAIVSNTEPVPKERSSKAPAWKDYLHSLQSEEAERKNEMRTIKVKQGDTLWRIATRAYGSGFLYIKIFEANPHLVSPASIATGETLRVPL